MRLTLNSALFPPLLKLCAFLIITCTTTIATSAEVYKWVDKNGNTHYTDKKPNHTESTSIRIKSSTASHRASPQSQASALDEKAARAVQAQQDLAQEESRKKEIKEKCSEIRKNLKVFSETSRIKIMDDGNPRYLSPEEISEKKARYEEQIKEFCQ